MKPTLFVYNIRNMYLEYYRPGVICQKAYVRNDPERHISKILGTRKHNRLWNKIIFHIQLLCCDVLSRDRYM